MQHFYRVNLTVLVLAFAFATAGCSPEGSQIDAEAPDPLRASTMKMHADTYIAAPEFQSGNSYLAFEHQITVSVANDEIMSAAEHIKSLCREQCTILATNLQQGDLSYAFVRMRMAPERVATVIKTAGALGQVVSQNTQADDLQNQVADNSKRIEMLISYRDKLQQLEQNSAQEVDALIRVASELSRVQSDLEYAQGEKARLYQRIDQPIVSVHLQTVEYDSFWSPIGKSLSQFGEYFAKGTAFVLMAIAFGIPSLIVLIVLFVLARFVWRTLK